jgi:Fe-S-cluster containining protein
VPDPQPNEETIREIFPAVYRSILPSFFDSAAVREEKATCSSCVMCPSASGAAPGAIHFRPDTKCCTFHPTLPNYLVGAILGDRSPALDIGRARIRDKIANRVGVTPMWLAAPRKLTLLLDAARDEAFGRSLLLRCPYFEADGGRCTIWMHRESSCTTFFCRYSQGADGLAFWKALEHYFRYVERSLARYATRALGTDLTEPGVARGALTLEDLEDMPPAADQYARYWGSWQGREEEFYVASYASIAELSRDAFLSIVGEEGARLLLELEAQYDALREPRLAEVLELNRDVRVVRVPDGVIVSTYSAYEPVHLTPLLFEVLREFNGVESTTDVRARLLRDRDLDVSPELLLELQALRVLIPVKSPPS